MARRVSSVTARFRAMRAARMRRILSRHTFGRQGRLGQQIRAQNRRAYFDKVRRQRAFAARRASAFREELPGTRRAREQRAARVAAFLARGGQHRADAAARVQRFFPGSRSRGALLSVRRTFSAAAARRLRKAIQLFGTDARRYYKARLIKEIDLTTQRRSGKLRGGVRVKKRTRGRVVELREDFPKTAFQYGNERGQYAYIVSSPGGANRGFIRVARAMTNRKFDKFLARARARVITTGG